MRRVHPATELTLGDVVFRQKMGTKFLLCNNALGIWCLELEARGKGKAQDLDQELRANLLPGVTIVPAMVIAIDQAQEAGIKYNRQ